MSTAPFPPSIVPYPDSPLPLHRRMSEEFQKLVRLVQSDCLVTRISSQFLGTDGAFQHSLLFGKLRTALLWDSLPGYLEEEGWEVAGSLGVVEGHQGEETAIPEFESLRLGEGHWFEVPKNLRLFLSRGEQRTVVRVTDESPQDFFGVGAMHLDSKPRFLERWLDYAQRHNSMRGAKLLANGQLAPRRESAEDSKLFLPAPLRERLDFALRRFTSPATQKRGVRRRAGLILAGPPGTGKSSIGRELAETLSCTLIWVTPGDLEGPFEVTEIFAIARWLAPTVVFIEDLDFIAESRSRYTTSNLRLAALMNELDGVAGDRSILTIATTNRLEVVEEAVCNRPGRFDQILRIEPPDAATRRELLLHRLRHAQVTPEDLDWAVAELDGATGAEIEEVAAGAIAAAVLETEDRGTETDETAPVPVERAHLAQALENVARPSDRREVGFAVGPDVAQIAG